MEAMLKKFQQKYRRVREEMNTWDELQTQFLKLFTNVSSIIERLQVLGDTNNYGGLAQVPGITNALLGKQMESLDRLFCSMKDAIKGFHRIVTSLEKIVRDGNQLLRSGFKQPSMQQMQLRVGIQPTLSQCMDGLRTLYDMHLSEYLVKSSAVSALTLKSSISDIRALYQLLADQPNIPKEEGNEADASLLAENLIDSVQDLILCYPLQQCSLFSTSYSQKRSVEIYQTDRSTCKMLDRRQGLGILSRVSVVT